MAGAVGEGAYPTVGIRVPPLRSSCAVLGLEEVSGLEELILRVPLFVGDDGVHLTLLHPHPLRDAMPERLPAPRGDEPPSTHIQGTFGREIVGVLFH